MLRTTRNILLAGRSTSLTPIIPTPETNPYIYDGLFTEGERSAIKTAYNNSTVYMGLFNEKSRIDANANNFISAGDQTYWRWTTIPALDGGGKVPDTQTGSNQDVDEATEIRDAAFVAWATENDTLKETIRDELLAQAAISTTNLSNSIWVQGRYGDRDLLFYTAEWLKSYIGAYLYVESVCSESDKTTIVTNYIVPNCTFIMNEIEIDLSIMSGRDIATNTEPPYTITGSPSLSQYTYKTSGGTLTNQTTTLMRRLNNRRVGQEHGALLMGYLASDEPLFRNACEMIVKDVLAYGWFPDGSFNEWHRSTSSRTNITGHGYSLITQGFCSMAAWIFNRKDGDDSLYTYTTSEGDNGTAGGSKSLLWACKEYAKHWDGTYTRHKWEGSVSSATLMNGTSSTSTQRIITDATWFGIPLLAYYPSDTDLEDQVTRTGAGYTNVDYVAISGSNYWGRQPFSFFGCFASIFLECYELI